MTEIEKLVEALELEIETAMAIGGGDVGAASAALLAAFATQSARIAELEAIRVAAIKFLKAHVPSGEEPDFIVDPEDVYDFDVALGRVQTYQTQGGYR